MEHSVDPPIRETIIAEKRLDALAKICNGLGAAIDGLARSKHANPAELSALNQQLLWMASRASWVERKCDPAWKPKQESCATQPADELGSPANEPEPTRQA